MKLAAALLIAVLLAGCSTVRLVYDNAGTYLRWRAASYVDLEGPMADELDERIAGFLSWHRAQALPQYAALADEWARRFSRGLQPADLVWGYDALVTQARESLRAGAGRIAPLLERLSPEQIAHIERRLAEDNRKFARENLRGDDRERRRRRTERNVERLEDWVGTLSQAQLKRVEEYSQRAPLLDELRERDRKRLQGEFLAIVRARQAMKRLPEFAAHWERGRDPAYAAALEAARREYFAMALDLERSLSPEQRARALRELGRYAGEFRALAAARK